MFEKYEKFWILGLIALAIYYFYKKGMTQQAPGMGAQMPTDFLYSNYFNNPGSVVNPVSELGNVRPAQGSTPVLFTPAQPSTVPVSQRVSAGSFSWYPAPPVLRMVPPDRSYTLN